MVAEMQGLADDKGADLSKQSSNMKKVTESHEACFGCFVRMCAWLGPNTLAEAHIIRLSSRSCRSLTWLRFSAYPKAKRTLEPWLELTTSLFRWHSGTFQHFDLMWIF